MTPVTEVFELNNIIMDDLRCEIFKAKAGKSTGLDTISNKLLKAAGDPIIGSLSQIFNLSIDTGIFPDDLKHTKVTPLYKSGDKMDCDNYRPISITSAVAKIFEKLVSRQLNNFLEIHQIVIHKSIWISHSTFHRDCTLIFCKLMSCKYGPGPY